MEEGELIICDRDRPPNIFGPNEDDLQYFFILIRIANDNLINMSTY